jgi:hypothetical protein
MPMKADNPNFKGFRAPQHTQMPNELFDILLKEMDDTELRVTLVAARKTLGWHKTKDAISLSTFIKLTGLSRQGVLDGIEKAKARGTLVEVGKGKRGVNIYELVITDDQSTSLTSLTSRPVLVYSVDQSDAATSLLSRHTKEKNIKKLEKEKELTPNGVRPPSNPRFTDIIKAWLDAQGSKNSGAYKNQTIQASAKSLFEYGITPSDVTAFTSAKKSDPFWSDKFVSFEHVANEIVAWKTRAGAHNGARMTAQDKVLAAQLNLNDSEYLAHMEQWQK